MAPISIPDAPKHLDPKAKKQWEDKYVTALKQAQIDHPDNESLQRAAATKEANKMLAVPAPESAEEIDKLADWQVLVRDTRTGKDGSAVRHCVTTDGRKYSHPVKSTSSLDISKMTKDQLIQHAASIGVTVDPASKKDDILAALQSAGITPAA